MADLHKFLLLKKEKQEKILISSSSKNDEAGELCKKTLTKISQAKSMFD